jgi:hypothetical protein
LVASQSATATTTEGGEAALPEVQSSLTRPPEGNIPSALTGGWPRRHSRRPWIGRIGKAGWVLAALIVAGAVIRGIACFALWPVATTLSDSAGYAVHAATSPLTDPQHPAGYSALLALVGLLTRDVAVTVVLQHALSIAAAVLLFAAVRQLVGSPWPALVPPAVVLLDTDEIFLEHNIMSEGPFLFILACAFYAGVKAIDARGRSRCLWAALAGAAVAGATVVRSAGLFAVPVIAVMMVLNRPEAARCRWRAPVAFVSLTAILLGGYGFANLQANGRFELTPATGWHLYARVGRFADCRRFTPPAGTAGLCESVPPVGRGWGPDFYLYASQSPARRLFGHIGSHDAEVRAFALQVIRHQPAGLADAVWVDVRRYFVPSSRPHGWYVGWDLDPQLEWGRQGGPAFTANMRSQMTTFFVPFVPHRSEPLIGFMNAYERVFGFGATLLSVCTLLTVLGLLVGPRRNRLGVLLFGVGGLAQLIGPTVGVLYMGRYLVPVAGLIAGGAAISVHSLLLEHDRRRAGQPKRVALALRFRENVGGGT